MIYDRKEESHQEGSAEDFHRKIQTKDMQWNDADKKAAVVQSKISELDKKEFIFVCGMEKPAKDDSGTGFSGKEKPAFMRTKKR